MCFCVLDLNCGPKLDIPLHLQSSLALQDEYIASFSNFLSKGQHLTACFLCWILCRLDCRWRLASASLDVSGGELMINLIDWQTEGQPKSYTRKVKYLTLFDLSRQPKQLVFVFNFLKVSRKLICCLHVLLDKMRFMDLFIYFSEKHRIISVECKISVV